MYDRKKFRSAQNVTDVFFCSVENKWIFKKKTDADGNVTVYKSRLVAKGFRQVQGVDYD